MPTEHKWVLIVDDEVGDALIIETMLKALGKGLSVVSVGSAEEALEQLAHRPFDLVVTDLRMPGMSGLELARRVKDTHPQTCTILVTAYASDEVEAEIRQLPSLAYLSKPFPVALFMQTVEQVLQAEMGEGALPASDDWGGAVQRALATLRRGAEARCALLVDGTGQVVAQAGTLDGLSEAVLPLLVEEASITARLHRDLEGGAEISLHHYEGSRYQVYTAVATDVPFLLIVLSQQTPLRRSGVVWLFLRRAIQELRRLSWVEDSLVETTAFGSLTPSQARALGLLPEES